MRGRKPRAIEVQEASGAFVKDPQRRPSSIVKADKEAPQMPKVIKNDKVASEVWDETCEVLRESGILSKTDTHLLTHYVLTYAEWVKCAEHIQKHGHEDGTGKTSPQSTAYFKLATQHTKLLPELGLSPSSRARLSVAGVADEKKEDEEDMMSLIKSLKRA